MELKSRQGSYLPYITIGNWFWQGTCGIRTWALGEDVFALSPCQWRASQGCTWPMLTQHCPVSGQGLNFLTARCSQPCGTGEFCQTHPHDGSSDVEPSETPSPSSWGPP